MIKVGVTGSNGFIGWHLCRTLALDTNKFEFLLKKQTNGVSPIDYFKSLKVKKEDIIRYARFWLKFLY